MFSVKPLPMTSMTTLPILLRFFQRYTFWNSIKISLLAEDRSDMEADYYEIGKNAIKKIQGSWDQSDLQKQWKSVCQY